MVCRTKKGDTFTSSKVNGSLLLIFFVVDYEKERDDTENQIYFKKLQCTGNETSEG